MSTLSIHSKEIAKGTVWSVLGTLFFKVCAFLYVILITRVAAQDDVGVLYLCLSIAGTIGILSDFGIVSSFIRYIPYFQGKNETVKIFDILKMGYLTVIVSVILAFLLFWQAEAIALFYHLPSLASGLRFFSVYLLLNAFSKIFSNALNGFADMFPIQLSSSLQNFLKLVLTIILFQYNGPNLDSLVFGYVLSFIPSSLILFFFMNKKLSKIEPHGTGITNSELMAEILPFGIMLMILNSFAILLNYADKLVLGYVLEPETSASLLGVYSVAYNLAFVVLTFPSAVGSIFLPVASRLFGKNDIDGLCSLIHTSQRWLLFITLPVGTVLIVFAETLLTSFYGTSYSSGASVVMLCTAAFVLNSITIVISYVLAAMRLVQIELRILGAAAFVNIASMFFLVPLFGINGAALATILRCIVSVTLLTYYGRKIIGYAFPSEVYKLIAVFITTIAVMFLLKPYLIPFLDALPDMGNSYINKISAFALLVVFSVFTLIFFMALSLIVKCFKPDDISLMKSVLDRMRMPVQISSFIIQIANAGVK